MVDISGRVDLYDRALVKALADYNTSDYQISLLIPGQGLLSLVPRKYKTSTSLIKHSVKALEGLLNYIWIILLVLFHKVNVLHLQWLPFIEVNSWELPILKIIKKFSPKTKLVLTIHNVYPHNMKDEKKSQYKVRFRKACDLIDEFIVHTNISKQDVVQEFGITVEKVNVCCHGVFVPNNVVPKYTNREGGRLHILQFGEQSYYKGTDIFVEAICGMAKEYIDKCEVHIVGGISQKYLAELQQKDPANIVSWKPYFLDESELNEEINNADLIVLPYRAISQSGVLLLSIYFGKLIVCSNLPSFVETMQGGDDSKLDEDLFFKSEDVTSLRSLLCKYLDRKVDEKEIHQRIENLQTLYSWESAAKSTISVYEKQKT